MKKNIKFILTIFGILFASAVQGQHSFADIATVTSVVPRYIQSPPTFRHECDTPVQKEHSNAGAIIGGITGAIVGSRFGKGNGQIVGTGVGAVGGAIAGDAIDNNRAPQQQCHQVQINSPPILSGYDIRYSYNNRLDGSGFTKDPVQVGQQIRVQVGVTVAQ